MKEKIKKYIPVKLGVFIKHSLFAVRGAFYYGNRYRCPVCNHSFRTMLPGGFDLKVIKEMEIVGAGRREQDICPYCQSTDRDRLVFLYLKYETDFFKKPASFLHIAPEPSLYHVFKKAKNIDYHPGTKYQEGFYYDSSIEVIDLMELPFKENSLDWVMCNHVLEHIPDDISAMREIFRVLKPGGKAVLQVPYSLKLEKTYEDDRYRTPEEREKHFGQFDHVRIYGMDYPDRLRSCGFDVEIIDQKDGLKHAGDLKKYALNPKEYLYVASKPESIKKTL